jgi:hypothetical protein
LNLAPVPALALVALSLLLVSCGGEGKQEVACARVRGDDTSAISFWTCESDAAALALQDREGFSSCRKVEGMDADAKPGDLSYQCSR